MDADRTVATYGDDALTSLLRARASQGDSLAADTVARRDAAQQAAQQQAAEQERQQKELAYIQAEMQKIAKRKAWLEMFRNQGVIAAPPSHDDRNTIVPSGLGPFTVNPGPRG